MITYSKVDYQRLTLEHFARLQSHQKPTEARLTARVHTEWPGYPQPLYRGDKAKNKLVLRFTGEVDESGHRKQTPVGRWRGFDPRVIKTKMSPRQTREARIIHGVGRPVVSVLRAS